MQEFFFFNKPMQPAEQPRERPQRAGLLLLLLSLNEKLQYALSLPRTAFFRWVSEVIGLTRWC
jgi:hypothetical protein